jgi:opacity protein-like surface antigen
MKAYLSTSVVIAGLLLAATAASAGQDQPPPINGVIGTIALEGTVDKTYKGINTIAVKTEDGVRHLLHFTTRTVVHGSKAAGTALDDVEHGARVVVHYSAEGDYATAHELDRVGEGGLKAVDGVVAKIDRRARTMSIRLANGGVETFRLTDRAASDVGKDLDGAAEGTAKVVVYYTVDGGHRTAHYFKRVP